MKKFFIIIMIAFSGLVLASCSDEDRSYSIDQVQIDADIQEDGVLEVRELYTYTFDGAYQGMTRSILADEIRDFKAFETDATDPTIDTNQLKELKVEKEEDDEQLLKIHTPSENETKSVLYSYEVVGSVKKYADVADMTYAFFDESNETDLANVDITIQTPEKTDNKNIHAFLHADKNGELLKSGNGVRYKPSLLEAGDTSEMRLIFPADQLTKAQVSKDKDKEADILAAERELENRRSHLTENAEKVTPYIWIVMGLTIIVAIFLLIVHPNRYQGDSNTDELLRILENTDPLFIKYIDNNEILSEDSFIAGLLSLKRRGIIKFEEVKMDDKTNSVNDESTKNQVDVNQTDESETTLRFTYIDENAYLDESELHLIDWLFTEKDRHGRYFLLDSLIVKDEDVDEKKMDKAEQFEQNFVEWKKKVEKRDGYQNLRTSFHGFAVFSILSVIVSFGLIYQFTTFDLLNPFAQKAVPLFFGLFAFLVIIFSKNKLVISAFFGTAVIAAFTFFSITNAMILLTICLAVSWLMLMIVPSYIWREDIKTLKKAINVAHSEFTKRRYPIGTDPEKIERRLEEAIVLGVGETYGEECGDKKVATKWTAALAASYPLLNNPVTTSMFEPSYLVLYSSSVGNGGISGGTTTSSTGGGGAGAF